MRDKELIERLPKVGGPAALAPLLPTLLPAKGLDADSVRYALGPAGYQAMGGVLPAQAVGFDKSAETVTAKYKNGGVLTLLLYPTPEIAGEHGRAIEAAMNQPGTARAAGTVKLRREGPLLVLTTGAWTPQRGARHGGGSASAQRGELRQADAARSFTRRCRRPTACWRAS